MRRSRELARLSNALASTLTPAADPENAIVGIEHEFSLARGQETVDFRAIIHDLGIEGERLDPSDPNAYRCFWGGVVTADGCEAEVATAPTPVGPGFAPKVQATCEEAASYLCSLLPSEIVANGYSTHVSVSVPDQHVVRASELAVLHFAPAVMLAMDNRGSPGLLVRPRRSRLEHCGDHVDGLRLRAAVVLTTGCALASASAAASRRARRALPPGIELRVDPAWERFGWYVDRRAPGCDLYERGRAARLARRAGGTVTAQEHLEEAWAVARPVLERHGCTVGDLTVVDDLVEGRLTLPSESDDGDGERRRCHPAPFRPVTRPGRLLGPHTVGSTTVRPVAITWAAALFAIEGGTRDAAIAIPRRYLAAFLDALSAGELGPVLERLSAVAPGRRVFSATTRVDEPAVFDRVLDPWGIVPDERDPVTGHVLPGGPSGPGGGRPGKRRSSQDPRHPPALQLARRARVPVLVAMGALLAVLVATGVVIARRGHDQATTIGVGGSPATRAGAGATTVPTSPAGAGRTVTFSDDPDGNGPQPTGVFVADIDGVPRRITDGDEPALSADGSKIAFVRGPGDQSELWVMNLPDGTPHAIVRIPNSEGGAFGPGTPRWSPDGTRIAFAFAEGSTTWVAVADADGSHLRKLSSNLAAYAFSADETLFFSVVDRVARVADGGRGAVVPIPGLTPALLDVSPDGRELLVSALSGTTEELQIVPLDGGPRRTLATAQLVDSAVWSPAGDLIAYTYTQRSSSSADTLAVVPTDGSRPPLILASDASRSLELGGWSGDGSTLGYDTAPRTEAPRGDVYLVQPDGSGLRRLASGSSLTMARAPA